MRIAFVIIALSIINIMPHSAFADEFGDRFYNKAPSGLGDFTVTQESEIPDIAMDDLAKDLQKIMPAAGEDDLTADSNDVDDVDDVDDVE